MIENLIKIRGLLTVAEQRSAVILFCLMLIGVLLETLGVGLVVPVIALLLQGDLFTSYPSLAAYLHPLTGMSRNQLVIAAMLSLVGIYLLKNGFLAILVGRQAGFAYGVQENLARRLFTIYLQQPYTFHLQRNSAELIRNITGEVGAFTTGLTNGLLLLTELMVAIGVASLLLVVEPVGAVLIVLVFGGAAWLFTRLTKEKVLRWGEERQIHDGLRFQHLQQGLGGAKDVKLLGREEEFLARFHLHNAKSARVSRSQTTLQSYPRLMLEMLAVSGLALLVISMVVQDREPASIVPILGLFAAAAFRLMPSVNRMLAAIQGLRYIAPVISVLQAEIRLPVADEAISPSLENGVLRYALTVSSLEYQYPGAPRRALDDVSISIKKGETLGLIGSSGSGKSTLVDVLLGLLRPGHGTVSVDGRDIHTCLRGWQDQIGYVPQAIYLTDDTLRNNVAFGLPDEKINEQAVQRAIRSAQLDTFVGSLPDGLDTIVGERGVRLSGGQRQRIGIARALYHDPAVLVLDEATSALDTATESGVMQAVTALHGSKTIIIIAHRLSTVEGCDRLVWLESGKIVAEGHPADVLAAHARSH